LENYEIHLPAEDSVNQAREERHSNWVNEMFRQEGRGTMAIMREAVSNFYSPRTDSKRLELSNPTRSGQLPSRVEKHFSNILFMWLSQVIMSDN
jgi:hypothetical protein